jgi:hypothetical protein
VLLLAACADAAPTDEAAVVAFSGDSCTYTGAPTFEVDTELTIEVVNQNGQSFGFSVWKVPDGTTVEDIQTQGMLTVGGDSENMHGILRPGSVASRELVVVLDQTGTWGMDCFTLLPGTIQTDQEYAAVVVEVQ